MSHTITIPEQRPTPKGWTEVTLALPPQAIKLVEAYITSMTAVLPESRFDQLPLDSLILAAASQFMQHTIQQNQAIELAALQIPTAAQATPTTPEDSHAA